MDIWQKMYEKAKALYQLQEVSDFVYARHVVAAVEAEDGQIFTGFCMEGTCGVFHLCAERAALFNMYQETGQTKVKRIITFRDQPPHGGPSGSSWLTTKHVRPSLWENYCHCGGEKNGLNNLKKSRKTRLKVYRNHKILAC